MKGRNLAAFTVATISGFVGGLCAQFLTPVHAQWRDVIRADQFRLVDFRGVDRARLGLSGGNQQYTYLYLMDRNGNKRVELVVQPNNSTPQIEFYDRSGNSVAVLP